MGCRAAATPVRHRWPRPAPHGPGGPAAGDGAVSAADPGVWRWWRVPSSRLGRCSRCCWPLVSALATEAPPGGIGSPRVGAAGGDPAQARRAADRWDGRVVRGSRSPAPGGPALLVRAALARAPPGRVGTGQLAQPAGGPVWAKWCDPLPGWQAAGVRDVASTQRRRSSSLAQPSAATTMAYRLGRSLPWIRLHRCHDCRPADSELRAYRRVVVGWSKRIRSRWSTPSRVLVAGDVRSGGTPRGTTALLKGCQCSRS